MNCPLWSPANTFDIWYLDSAIRKTARKQHLKLFLDVCDAHGNTATQHHNQLVNKFIEKPADDSSLTNKQDMTASGPPLPVLLNALKKLRDLRTAAQRDDIPTRYQDFEILRNTLSSRG